MIRYVFLIFVITILITVIPAHSAEIYPQNLKIHASLSDYDYNSNSGIEKLFKENLNSVDNIVYTIIPMGVVVSINGYIFFNEGSDEINASACCLLDIIARLIKIIDKPCLVESNTTSSAFKNSNYLTNWELATVRANNIVSYLITKEIEPNKIRSNGFGELMPFFKDNNANMQERIDFIIFNYEK